jgi:hypothetical protein
MAVIYSIFHFLSFSAKLYTLFLRIICMVGVLLASFFLTEVQAQTYVFARLDGIPMNTTGWTLNGEAAVNNLIFNNNSELLLASAKTFTSGGIFFNQPINLSMCSKCGLNLISGYLEEPVPMVLPSVFFLLLLPGLSMEKDWVCLQVLMV